MTITNNVFFWAFISMFGLVGANAVVSGKKLGRYPLFGSVVVTLFVLGRFALVLPFCPQPRFEIWGLHGLIGGVIFIMGLVFCLPAFIIKPVTAPDQSETLHTTGFYSIVRNPTYTGELLWCLGWAIMFRSTMGVALFPIWWIGLLFHIAIEEESLELEFGTAYLQYKQKTKGRIIPGIPI